jgi:hypothetical protein
LDWLDQGRTKSVRIPVTFEARPFRAGRFSFPRSTVLTFLASGMQDLRRFELEHGCSIYDDRCPAISRSGSTASLAKARQNKKAGASIPILSERKL